MAVQSAVARVFQVRQGVTSAGCASGPCSLGLQRNLHADNSKKARQEQE